MRERIRALREDKDLKQRELAAYLNINQATYSDYETGVLNIPIPALIKLAEYYDTSIDYLLEVTDDPRPYKRRRAVNNRPYRP